MKAPAYLRYCYLLLAAVLPWSAERPVYPGAHAQLLVPAEIIIAAIGILLFGQVKPLDIFREHPLVRYAALWLLWGWICVSTSAFPLVSFKYMIVATSCCWVFLLPAVRWSMLMDEALPIFAFSMGLASVRVIFLHGFYYAFRNDQANLPAMPFFDDHNLWAAIISLLVFAIWVPKPEFIYWQHFRWGLTAIFIAGVVLSTSRGAWVSLSSASIIAALLMAIRRKPVLKILAGAAIVIGTGWIVIGPDIGKVLQRDVSMMERLNRYQCAIQMADEKPITGFGPGTFAVSYLPYQRAESKTRISLAAPLTERSPENYGHGGGAHSEYFQAMAETGWVGLGIFCLFWGIILKTLSCGIKFDSHKTTCILLLAALLTFLVHGILNNFSHDPRITFLVWIIVGKLSALHSCNRN
jgi:putative inorganic carbon (HCO3(-)) transporter